MSNPYELPNCAIECAFICKLSTEGFCPRPALEKQLAAMRELSRMADEEYEESPDAPQA